MKTICFKEEHSEHFQYLYLALMNSQRGFKGRDLVILDKVFSKIEGVGRPVQPSHKNEPLAFELGDGGSVEFEDTEYELLKDAVEQAPFNGYGARKLARAIAWMDTSTNGT